MCGRGQRTTGVCKLTALRSASLGARTAMHIAQLLQSAARPFTYVSIQSLPQVPFRLFLEPDTYLSPFHSLVFIYICLYSYSALVHKLGSVLNSLTVSYEMYTDSVW